MKVYIVRSGEWDDEFIEGVFLNKDKAEKFCKLQDVLNNAPICCGSCYITEFDALDDKVSNNIRIVKYYVCDLDTSDGQIFTDDSDPEDYTKMRIYDEDLHIEKGSDLISCYSISSYEEARNKALEIYNGLNIS